MEKLVSRVIALFSAFLLYLVLVSINFYFFDKTIRATSFWGAFYYIVPCSILYKYIRNGGWWSNPNPKSKDKSVPKPNKKQISDLWGIPPKKEAAAEQTKKAAAAEQTKKNKKISRKDFLGFK